MTVKKSKDVPTDNEALEIANKAIQEMMTVKKSKDVPTDPSSLEDTIDREIISKGGARKTKANPISESPKTGAVITMRKDKARKVPKLDITVDDLKTLIREVVAAELQKWSNQSTSKDLDNSASKKPYLNSEGQYILLERTPEEISRQAQSIRDMFTEWEREYDAEEQRETFAYLQKALINDFPSEDSFSENPLSVSQ